MKSSSSSSRRGGRPVRVFNSRTNSAAFSSRPDQGTFNSTVATSSSSIQTTNNPMPVAQGRSDRVENGQSFNVNAIPFVPTRREHLSSFLLMKDDDSFHSMRDRLIQQLERENYECMICCQTIASNQWIWSCSKCYHMFHMNRADNNGCITRWAMKSYEVNQGWRCPSCQQASTILPSQYRCFCGKRLNPTVRRAPDIAHSCGGVCGRQRGDDCPHKCTQRCHPGPCPGCPLTVMRECDCGIETCSMRCGMGTFQCTKVCGKPLDCAQHFCKKICHKGDCGTCGETIRQRCYCGNVEREVKCTVENAAIQSFSCRGDCKGFYACKIHKCQSECHSRAEESNGTCGDCPLSPNRLTHCPCGKRDINKLQNIPRLHCTDLIPCCGSICDKILHCGSSEKPHRCKEKCHIGPCPPCVSNSSIVCRCGGQKKTVPCSQLVLYNDDNPFLCERRCKKMKTCRNHKCQEKCCIEMEHFCAQICNRKLDCGIHFCDRLCHVGQCPRCLQASFEDQFCLCGATMREPPIPCGSALPSCDQLCARQHVCDHPVTHNCHSEPNCPPCTFLTRKPCYGGHEVRNNIPCYLDDVSCGRACGKALSCGVHSCNRICHPGDCGTICKQPCNVLRMDEACDHCCALPCHGTDPCPSSICILDIHVTCACGRKSTMMRCCDVEKAWIKYQAVQLAENVAHPIPMAMIDGQSMQVLTRSSSIEKFKCVPCDGDCTRQQRNRRLADALQIEGETNDAAQMIYSDFLKAQLKQRPIEVNEIESAMVELVESIDLPGVTQSRSHSFRPMVSDLRRFIHEYAVHFRLLTVSMDSEPQRNVVASGKQGVACIPSPLLTGLKQPSSKVIVPSTVAVSVGKDYSWETPQMQTLTASNTVTFKRGPPTT